MKSIAIIVMILIEASNAFSATGLRRFVGVVSQKSNPVARLEMRKTPSELDDNFAESNESNASTPVDFHLAESREEMDLPRGFAKDQEMVESCLRNALHDAEMAAAALDDDDFANMIQEIKEAKMDFFATGGDRDMMESCLRDALHHAVIASAAVAFLGSSSRSTSALPRSMILYTYSEGDTFWNPSAQVDKEGFLAKDYLRIPSELEIGRDTIEGKHRKSTLVGVPVRIRQVPGQGDCLFHSLTICLSKTENGTHFCYDKNMVELKRLSRLLREQTVDFLASEPKRLLYLQGSEYMRASELIKNAASQYGCTAKEYCGDMRQESVWGGGPEVVALCNLLKRPIHVYELHPYKNKRDFWLRRMTCFGSPKFDRKEALHILCADSRFPDVIPGKQLATGDHFLAVFPEPTDEQ